MVKVSCSKRAAASVRVRVASDRIRRGKRLVKPGSLRVRALKTGPRVTPGSIDQPGDGLGKGAGNGGYAYGWCTYYAWTRRPDLNNLGNAGDWKANAERRRIPTGPANAPVAGAVAWWNSSNPSTWFTEGGRRVNYGHVAYVEQVRGNQFLVSEMNWPTWNVVSQRWITPGGRGAPDGFIYGGPARGGPSSGPSVQTVPGSQMLLDSAGQVWAKNTIGDGGWTRETPGGHTAIAAGDSGLQMLLDSAGQVWAKNTIGDGGWTRETPGGHTAIAAGSP
jgi:surface antigen